jgi:hypothetical protein
MAGKNFLYERTFPLPDNLADYSQTSSGKEHLYFEGCFRDFISTKFCFLRFLGTAIFLSVKVLLSMSHILKFLHK